MTMDRNTVLRTEARLRIRRSSGYVRVSSASNHVDCNPEALAILAAFWRARPLGEGLAELKPTVKGVQAWLDLNNVIQSFYRAGILVEPDRPDAAARLPPKYYDDPKIHIKMLNDVPRTQAFTQALRRVVRPGDVVVDVGTGTGVLAVAAAQAGARRVYAIEASDIADVAERLFADNGVADRVQLVRGWSTQVELPEKADVLVSEMIGDEPLGERLLEMTRDATRRLLAPNARFVPHAIELIAQAVRIPDALLDQRTFTARNTSTWTQAYGIDYARLAEIGPRCLPWFKGTPTTVAGFQQVSAPAKLALLDLTSLEELSVDAFAEVAVAPRAVVNGVLVYSNILLAPGLELSTGRTSEENSWHFHVHLVDPPIELAPGERLRVSYRYGQGAALIEASRVGA